MTTDDRETTTAALPAGEVAYGRRTARRFPMVSSALRVRIDAANAYVGPDLTVVRGTPRMHPDGSDTRVDPTVVLEVLSPSTGHHDRGRKLAAYRTIPSREAVVLVWQDARRVEVHPRGAGAWTVSAAEGPGAVASLPPPGARLPPAQVYDTQFPMV